MFEVEGTVYTLKYNTKKVKTIELVAKTSIVGEVTKNNGIMPYATLETLFSMALVEESTNEVVKQKVAAEMFEKVVEENGLITVNMAIVEKLQDDMGFMFR
ncbi:segregation and condensation protein B [Bacillus sp. MRMR6]|uniref:segregation and condensation protein B n=1 Tax=Bacillus sp. MRMR6 TaxID=1928617 RepID=UPI000951421C|nr:segregation and condensation protein B [Bacillus sp. MRMR6]OLS39141.1 segregation and condensation protein B [Bacillus sp. MRMR6]